MKKTIYLLAFATLFSCKKEEVVIKTPEVVVQDTTPNTSVYFYSRATCNCTMPPPFGNIETHHADTIVGDIHLSVPPYYESHGPGEFPCNPNGNNPNRTFLEFHVRVETVDTFKFHAFDRERQWDLELILKPDECVYYEFK